MYIITLYGEERYVRKMYIRIACINIVYIFYKTQKSFYGNAITLGEGVTVTIFQGASAHAILTTFFAKQERYYRNKTKTTTKTIRFDFIPSYKEV